MPDPYELPEVTQAIALALAEDLRGGADLTTQALVPEDARLRFAVTAKSAGVICGLPIFERVFAACGGDVALEALAADGTAVAAGSVVLRGAGRARTLLAGERTALNIAQRLSGIATLTARFVAAVAGTRARIYDTRKTTPGWRALEKHAVACAGGCNHRLGLHDAVLIKENHIALGGLGTPARAVERARQVLGRAVRIAVEIERVADLPAVVAAGAEIVLLDNMALDELRAAVAWRDGSGAAVELEASGGVTLATVRAIAETGVDRISVGALTHSAPALDLSMRCAAL
ncbi:MAG: carboxylating nicotinate-nucleotide diphosphorylase [Planctomycetota bacterium]|nr:carboxylating nicotinate-nucleotide diphosphorylase [Planctomycetota bacterium]MCX8039306.1 carboxylating nicotinate-nucleotide diphosphorylase [Planctomycetota bacterium]